MKRFLLCFAVVMIGYAVRAENHPNVVFILADDLGISDIGAYASHFAGRTIEGLFYETPHMDRLVHRGIAFSQAYAQQLCSPTRAAIMTGVIPSKLGFTTATPFTKTYYNQSLPVPEGFSPHDVLEHTDKIKEPQAWINGRTNTAVDPERATLPGVLGSYRSVFIGKWHIGGHGAAGFQPADHGFEVPAWFDSGASDYFWGKGEGYYRWPQGWNAKKKPSDAMPQAEFAVGSAGSPPHADYLTDDLSNRAVSIIREHAAARRQGKEKRPLFLYLSHFAVHTPLQAPKESIAHFEHKPQRGTLGHSNAVYAAMVKHLDNSVGAVVQALEETGMIENTLVVLTSDNGGVEYTDPPATDNTPFHGGKAMLYEGGIRVPLVYYLPGRFESAWCDTPVNCIDHLPTLAELTENSAPDGIDGVSMVSLLENPSKRGAARTFVWHYPFNVGIAHPDDGLFVTPHSAIRTGDYKLIWDWHGKLYLFDIENDPFEKKNLAEAMPGKRDALMRSLQDWLAANVASRYMPTLNPDYDEKKDVRAYPFVDLTKEN